MFIADAHCDTLRAVGVGRRNPESCTVTAARMKNAGVGLQTFAMFTALSGPEATPYRDGLNMVNAIDKLDATVYRGRLPELPPEAPGGVISIEGGEMLEGSMERFEEFYQTVGVRMIALTWNYENEIGHPAKLGPENGLKPFGLKLLREMDKKGVYADASHLNEAGFWDIVDHMDLPPVASHSNVRELCEHTRNLTRDQIKAIIEKKGFIGVNFYSDFLANDRDATLEDVFRHIDYIAQMGGVDVLGFGSDFDGIDKWPDGLAQPEDFVHVLDLMRSHGYAEKDVEAIAGGNLWRLYKRADALRLRQA